ncbi:hypothetical protein [Bordetella genomosp. 10]|uniref:hypothetical protein n=1 Tax=Bordetella genomosp. 10 TaxID=1416804 RepID=UPI00211B4355|nr:hypothetical protein [Bordetella genomosp. 10]
MNTKIASLLSNIEFDDDASVAALHHQDIAAAFSLALPDREWVLLHILYPRTDAKTHASQQALVHALHGHGLHVVARLIEDGTHYLLFHDHRKAWKVYQEIRGASLAIGVHLYFLGLHGAAAEDALEARAHQHPHAGPHADPRTQGGHPHAMSKTRY